MCHHFSALPSNCKQNQTTQTLRQHGRGPVSPVLKHFCHQSQRAPEHGPRWVCHHFSHLPSNCKPNQTTLTLRQHGRGPVSPVLKHFCHQSHRALEHGPRWVCHHFSHLPSNCKQNQTTQILRQHGSQSRLETLSPSKPQGSGTRTKVSVSSLHGSIVKLQAKPNKSNTAPTR